MVIRETELGASGPGEEALRSDWAQAEIEPELAAYEKALGICENLMRFAQHGTDTPEHFRAYFVHEVAGQAAIERHFRRILKLDSDLPQTEIPLDVLTIGDVSLYRWSNLVEGKPFDTYYEAVRGDEQLEWYKPAEPTEAAEA